MVWEPTVTVCAPVVPPFPTFAAEAGVVPSICRLNFPVSPATVKLFFTVILGATAVFVMVQVALPPGANPLEELQPALELDVNPVGLDSVTEYPVFGVMVT
jgi:hypothetical protein